MRYDTTSTYIDEVLNYNVSWPHTPTDNAIECAEELVTTLEHYYIDMLNAEIGWLESEECVSENIRCNEYTFDADGERRD